MEFRSGRADGRADPRLVLGRPGLWRSVYLAILAPTLLILCLLTGPFQVPDERAHFLRTVQLAGGEIMPALAPDGKGSGGEVDANAARLSAPYASIEQNSDAANKFSLARLRGMFAVTTAGRKVFAEFDNTVIYFPLSYAVPVLAYAMATALHPSPLLGFYAGRLANAALAILLTSVVLAWIQRGAAALFVTAALPMLLFETASLAPDALLTPAAMVLAWMFSEMIEDSDLRPAQAVLLATAGFVLGVNKFVYLPFSLMMPLVALLRQRRVTRSVRILAAGAVLTMLVLALWTRAIAPFVLPQRAGMVIDVAAQTHFVLTHPLAFARAILNTVRLNLSFFPATLIGRHLGWGEVVLPGWLIGTGMLALVATLAADRRRYNPGAAVTVLTLLAVLGSVLGIFFSLYVGFSPVGADAIDGVQGRYFLPLLPILAVGLPKLAVPARWVRLGTVALIAWGVADACTTLWFVAARYWMM